MTLLPSADGPPPSTPCGNATASRTDSQPCVPRCLRRQLVEEPDGIGSGAPCPCDVLKKRVVALESCQAVLLDDGAVLRTLLGRVDRTVDALIAIELRTATADLREDVGARQTWRPASPRPSPREAEVIACLARGMADEEIALELAVRPDTVRSHLRRIYHKLGAADRAQAVLLATKHGWI